MTEAYHTNAAERAEADDEPRLALRRHTDRCFHLVEEVVPGGYIVEGILIDADEVAEVRETDANGAPLPPCE